MTKIRDDKDWKTSTSLSELKSLFDASKESSKFDVDFHKSEGEDVSGDDDDDGGEKKEKEKNKKKDKHKEEKSRDKDKSKGWKLK